MEKTALPKKIGWPILVLLVFWDAFITFRAGGEGNPLLRPIVNYFGLHALWILAILALGLFYLLVKYVGKYTQKYEGYSQGEEIVLTNLVIAFATYDFYLTFLLPYFGYLGLRYHYAIIPVIIIPLLIYNLWLEHRKKKVKKK